MIVLEPKHRLIISLEFLKLRAEKERMRGGVEVYNMAALFIGSSTLLSSLNLVCKYRLDHTISVVATFIPMYIHSIL